MSASNKFLYCSQCGSKLIKACKICTKCRVKIRTVVKEKVQRMTQLLARNFSKIFLIIKVMKELGFSNVNNAKEQGMKTLQGRNQLQSFRF